MFDGANGSPVSIYQTVIRRALFALPAETAHSAGKWALRRAGIWRRLGRSLRFEDDAIRQSTGGLQLANPIGLAPGFDKDCEVLEGLAHLGFGFLEAGTVLPRARIGNARPRLLRYPEQAAIVNAMGLPNRGVDYSVAQLQQWAGRRSSPVPVIVSFMGFTLEEYLDVFTKLQPVADALEVALRCPNTPDEPNFVDPGQFDSLLTHLSRHKQKPMFVKLPTLDVEVSREELHELVSRGLRHGVDGFVVSGTHPVAEPRLSTGRGSLSGRPVIARTLHAVREVYGHTGNRAALVAQGGISSGRDAFAAIAEGASAVSLYTALVYGGPAVVRSINVELLALMRSHGVSSVAALRGRAAGSQPTPEIPASATIEAIPQPAGGAPRAGGR